MYIYINTGCPSFFPLNVTNIFDKQKIRQKCTLNVLYKICKRKCEIIINWCR